MEIPVYATRSSVAEGHRPFDRGTATWSKPSFSSIRFCAHLHTLQLSMASPQLEDVFAMEYQIFSSIRSPNLRIACIDHMATEPIKLPSSWPSFVSVLASPKFGSLMELYLSFVPSWSLRYVRSPNLPKLFEEIKVAFADFYARGILKLPNGDSTLCGHHPK
ncbi:hypothetical protein OBBRIDRAFT_419764 [Obba rivulosa]|uniref:Uncharacterized protein n=1 Tax=Obba rivulosa TaxID=1052685 RepID=A0A8E2ASB2_9APHY|nr:hypothetical protein OBBRIDRAFT_419764 [Obba rivulosa]